MTAYPCLEIRSYQLKSDTHTAFLRLMADEAVPLIEHWASMSSGTGQRATIPMRAL